MWFYRYGTITFFSIGTVLMGVLAVVQRKKYGLKPWQCVVFTLLLSAVGMAGVRLLAIVERWKDLLEGYTPGGMSFFGAVFLVPLLMPLLCRPFRLRRLQTLDLCAPCVAGIVSVMRINCWFTECCGGRTFEYMGRSFTPPTQIIDGTWDFLLMGLLLYLNLNGKREGASYPIFLVGYGVMRFLVEFLRETEKDWLYLSHGQWFSLLAIAIGALSIHRMGLWPRKMPVPKDKENA
ncbi:MAG: prolipoprotein diacylglyceryl transferase [Oscillospiraceae bacterium]|nr:prolipoprotein diacylglyceryl transferase [Oscillospiraceae bacterium]